ncbi:Uu.00g093370.m01.CDS01 [Anthostomella pinea]|uniref:Uu.00g093370.m01.CDS01 n=1 Tax=Anthostomella pinea TaxID=933095 RepID=A0AAI8VNF2_9PEZI|nr:Uu.00g093370.m01.CDS01 [Anthostomella pinea]
MEISDRALVGEQKQSKGGGVYKALAEGEIRVLVLAPGKFGAPLIASLDQIGLSRAKCDHMDDDVVDTDDRPGDSTEHQTDAKNIVEDERGEEEEYHYEAISYAWGEPRFTCDLRIPGFGKLKITQTLHDALQ